MGYEVNKNNPREHFVCPYCKSTKNPYEFIVNIHGEPITDEDESNLIGFSCTECGHTLIFNEGLLY
ncbi:hypothetical protein [Priestia aryabhattai]|uniref:hypothetical protein n=1 Tax=Priestia aryabhattai TaxID=412384 RepID=UPI001C8D0E1E|nr:hypothetical protein [Priestia aryabhattai]MBY0213879.1 hypothetical protein [Priestia aryabhattai]